MTTIQQAAWAAMRAISEVVANRGEHVAEKLEAWRLATSQLDAKVNEVDEQLRHAELARVEINAALDCFEAGHLDGVLNALKLAKQLLEAQQ